MNQKTDIKWTALSECTREDVLAMERADEEWERSLVPRLVEHLRMLDDRGENNAMPVSRLEHGLQTATRAMDDGRDDEYVVCALLHDIGDLLAPHNHAAIAADIVRPYVSERNHWMVQNHSVFQGYFFFQHLGLDPNARDAFRGHPWFDHTAEFCEKYDQPSFDPGFPTRPLEDFIPAMNRVFTKPRAAESGDGMTKAEMKSVLESIPA
jgi:predicted HD phosphohydrolase